MGTVTGGHRFEVSHKSGTPEDPNLVSADDIAAYMLIDSVAISTATSKAVSTVGAAAPDSSNLSIADSKGVSAGGRASIADSKAISGSVNTSVADSKAISVSGSTSQADSKAVSVANSVPILTVVAASQSVSTADSKATSAGTVLSTINSPAAVPAEGRTVTTLTSFLFNNARFNVKDCGAIGNGTADDTSAVQLAVTSAIAAGKGIVYFPPGRYRLTSTITIPTAVTLLGEGGISGGINNAACGFPTILHDFVGDQFVFNGATGLLPGSGGGVENLRIVQVNGLPATTGGVGSAIKLTCVDGTHKPSWVKLRGLIIEEQNGITAPWTWAINVDGGANHILDVYIGECSSHTTGLAPSAGALRLDGATQTVVYNSNFYDTGALISLGDTNLSASCQFVNIQALTLAMDRCRDLCWMGGILTNLTETANTDGNNTIIPGRWAGTFTPLGGGGSSGPTGIMRYVAANNTGGSLGGWDFLRPIQIPNNRYYAGVTLAGGATKALVGLDGNDAIRVGPNADGIIALGSAPSFAGLVNGDTLVGGKLKVNGALALTGALTAASTVQVQSAGFIRSGTGAPESAITGWVSDLYLRTDGAGATSLYVKESGNGTNTGWKAIAASGDAVTFGASTLGATSATSLTVANAFGHQGTTAGFYNVAPVTRAAAITAPTAPSAGYVQAEAASMKTAVDAIRVALQNIGLTL